MGSCARPKSKKPPPFPPAQSSRGEGGGSGEDKNHVFFSTKGVCVLCFDDCPTDVSEDDRRRNLQTSINFCRLTSRYLRFNLAKLVTDPVKKVGRNCKSMYKSVEENDNNKPRDRIGVELCDRCLTLAEGFCKLHFQLEFHQMVLDRCVKSISDVILEANKKPRKTLFTMDDDDEDAVKTQQKTCTRLTVGGFRSANNLRNKLYEKSIEKLSQSYPKICLRRICKSGDWISLLNGKSFNNGLKEATSKGPQSVTVYNDPETVVASLMGCIVSFWIVLSLSFINPDELIKKVKFNQLLGMQQDLLHQQHKIIKYVEAQGQIPIEVLNGPIFNVPGTKTVPETPSPKKRGRKPGSGNSSSPTTKKKKEQSLMRNHNGIRRTNLRKSFEKASMKLSSSPKKKDASCATEKTDTSTKDATKALHKDAKKLPPKDVQVQKEIAQIESSVNKNVEVEVPVGKPKSKLPQIPISVEIIPTQTNPSSSKTHGDQSLLQPLDAPATAQDLSNISKHKPPATTSFAATATVPVDSFQSTTQKSFHSYPQEYQPPSSQHIPPQPYSNAAPLPPSYTCVSQQASQSYYSQHHSTTEAFNVHPSPQAHSSSSYPSTSSQMYPHPYDPNYYYNNSIPAPPPPDTSASQYNYGYNYSSYNYNAPTTAPPPPPSNTWPSYDHSASHSTFPPSESETYYNYDSTNPPYYNHNPMPPSITSGGVKDQYNYENYGEHHSQNYYYPPQQPVPPSIHKTCGGKMVVTAGVASIDVDANNTCSSAGNTPSPPLTHTHEEQSKNMDSMEEPQEEMDTEIDYDGGNGSSQMGRPSSDFQALSIFPEVHWRQSQETPKIPCTISGCTEQFVRTDHLDLHLRSHGSFQCNFCHLSFSKGHTLALHEKSRHSKTPTSESSSSSNKCKCSRCDYISLSQNNFFIHFLSEHLNIQLYDQRCEICKKKFVAGARKYVKRNHFKNYHDTEGKNPNSIFRCKICNAPFLKESQLKDHDTYCEGLINGHDEENDVYDEIPSRAASTVSFSSIDTAISLDTAVATADRLVI